MTLRSKQIMEATDVDLGMRLVCEDKKTLTIGLKELVVYDPALKKANRNACVPGSTNAPGKESIPFYNILWASASKGSLTIDYASQPTKTFMSHAAQTFALPKPASASTETDPDTFVSTLMSRAYGRSKLRKRALVLINPSSGPGGAVRKWEREVKPLFDAARMGFEVRTLTRGGEAAELAEQVDIDRYDTIIACSGDGTPHEIFNGLAKRPDAGKALRSVAISHVPCGSGNGMAINLYGSNQASLAAVGIIKGVVTPMDLVSVTHGESRVMSFLSQSVGIVAESDLGTEHLRWMGSTRFEVGLLMCVLQKRRYPCDLAVKLEIEDKEEIKAHYKRVRRGGNPLEESEELVDGVLEPEGLPQLKYGTVQDKLPEGWEFVAHDKLANFYCGNMAFMSPNANFFPASVPSDGCMDLVMVNADLTRVTATKTLLAVEAGKFYELPHVSYRKISAYRLVPRDQEDGYISIDGEKIPFGPYQAEIHKGLGRVISKAGFWEADGPPNWEQAKIE